jgi:hypothetical protein
MHLKEIGFNTKNWVDSAKGRDYWRARHSTFRFHKPWTKFR